jgi:hypothetical protein
MHITSIKTTLVSAAMTLSLAVPGAAMAYGKNDAIKDCKQRLRDEYKLTDFRHESAQKLSGSGHKYKVTGNTKVKDKKYDFSCEIKDRHVASINYDGPKPKGMTGAQKLAVGAAAAIAAGVIASKVNEQDETTSSEGGLPTVDTAAARRILSPDETLQTLNFPATGTKTVSGRIQGYKTTAYALPVSKGQRLEVQMDTKSSSAYFNIVDATDTSGAALFAGEREGTNTALIRVAEDGTYVIRPYLVRAVARRGSSASYTFKIERQ